MWRFQFTCGCAFAFTGGITNTCAWPGANSWSDACAVTDTVAVADTSSDAIAYAVAGAQPHTVAVAITQPNADQ